MNRDNNCKNILFLLNGHKYVSYFFEPVAQCAYDYGVKVSLALPKSGSYEKSNWPLEDEAIRFRSGDGCSKAVGAIFDFLQRPFIGSKVDVLHVVTTHMILFTLFRLATRREKFSGEVVLHFIGLGRVLGGTGVLSNLLRFTFRVLWFMRKRKKITYRCIYLNDEDLLVLSSIFGDQGIAYKCVPGAGVRKDRFEFHEKNLTEPLKLLFVGRLLADKGIERFLALIETLKLTTDLSVVGDIVGGFETQAYENHIRDVILNKGLDHAVTLHGEVSNPNEFFKTAHFFIFPSYYGEGVPTVLLESQYCGTPCLVSNIAGCRTAVLDGVTGKVVESKSVHSWRDNLLDLISRGDYTDLCKKGHDYVAEYFDADILARKTIQWLLEPIER